MRTRLTVSVIGSAFSDSSKTTMIIPPDNLVHARLRPGLNSSHSKCKQLEIMLCHGLTNRGAVKIDRARAECACAYISTCMPRAAAQQDKYATHVYLPVFVRGRET